MNSSNQNPSIQQMPGPNNSPPEPKPKNKKHIIQDLWKLIEKKPATYQFRDQELVSTGVQEAQLNEVREAISKANHAKSNFMFKALGWLFGQFGNFVDTLVKAILILGVFLLSLQAPYINQRANQSLIQLVNEAELNYQKYEITVQQIAEILARYKVQEAKIEQDIPEQVKKDREAAKRWLKYRYKDVEDIWISIPQDLTTAQAKLGDLWEIYSLTAKNYKPGLPIGTGPYIQAAIVALIALITYIFTQSALLAGIKNSSRKSTLYRQLNKIL